MSELYGDEFQSESKYYRNEMKARTLDWHSKPEYYKRFPNAERRELPHINDHEKSHDLFSVIKQRKSIRSYSQTPISLYELAYVLWCSTGIQRSEKNFSFRTTPSAGALYPIETYIAVNNVNELNQGIYHYAVQLHALELVKPGFFGKTIAWAMLGQQMGFEAPAVLIWTAIFERSKWKYDQRAYRYIYLDAGHIAQNCALAAIDIGLGSCQIGAFYDDEFNNLIEVDGINESIIYLSAIGNPF